MMCMSANKYIYLCIGCELYMQFNVAAIPATERVELVPIEQFKVARLASSSRLYSNNFKSCVVLKSCNVIIVHFVIGAPT